MDINIIIFKTISNFIKDLSELYGKQHHPLNLYRRLIEKTSVIHEQAISKNIEIFKTFCNQNKDAITVKDTTLLKEPLIKYSDKVFIDMDTIFKLSGNDVETLEAIWKHLLAIMAYVDPSSNAKKLLKEMSQNDDNKEAKFIKNIMETVESTIDPNTVSNPMTAVTSIMSSGVFTNLVSNMQNGIESGDLDLTKLMGTVQNMMSSIGGQGELKGFDLAGMMNTMKLN